MFWWGPGPGWLFGLLWLAFWVSLIVIAVLLLRHELPNLRLPERRPPALRILEERYARGEISREEFLERRRVLLAQTTRPTPPPTPPPEPPPTAPPPGPPPPTGAQTGPPDVPRAPPESEPPGPSAPPGAAPPYLPEPPDESRPPDEPTQPIQPQP